MPITITPVELVTINFNNALPGDSLVVEFEDESPIFLTLYEYRLPTRDTPLRRMSLTPELLPRAIYAQVAKEVHHLIQRNVYGLKQWWDLSADQPHSDMFSELLDDVITNWPYVSKLQHGEKLIVSFEPTFRLENIDARKLLWTSPSPIKQIRQPRGGEVERQIGLYQGERELRAL